MNEIFQDLFAQLAVAGLELLSDKGLQEGAALDVGLLHQLPLWRSLFFQPWDDVVVVTCSSSRAHFVLAAHPDPHGRVGAHFHSPGRVLEQGREDGVLVEAQGAEEGDAVVDFVGGDWWWGCCLLLLVLRGVVRGRRG